MEKSDGMMRYTVTIPSMRPKYMGHVCSDMKSALKFAYREAKENKRLVEIKKYMTNIEIATVWIYNGSIEQANGKMLVKFKNKNESKIKVLKADGTISKRRVF